MTIKYNAYAIHFIHSRVVCKCNINIHTLIIIIIIFWFNLSSSCMFFTNICLGFISCSLGWRHNGSPRRWLQNLVRMRIVFATNNNHKWRPTTGIVDSLIHPQFCSCFCFAMILFFIYERKLFSNKRPFPKAKYKIGL